jgi:hypothetical protein
MVSTYLPAYNFTSERERETLVLCSYTFLPAITSRETDREVGGSERHYEWGEQNISSILKVPRHCPFVLLVTVRF